MRVVADHTGKLLWISPALPGGAHDLAAACTHRIVRICERQGVPILADRVYIGVGSWVTTPIRRLPHQDLTTTRQTSNRALAAARFSGRTKRRAAEVLARPSQIPLQSQPHARHRRSRPHLERQR